jgi:hypothetical protein
MKEQEIVEELMEYFEKELDEARAGQSPFSEEEIEIILKALKVYKIG